MEIKMENKKKLDESDVRRMAKNSPEYREDGSANSIPGINTPGIELPAVNPPVPNRAWTAMKKEIEGGGLTEEERRDIIYGEEEDFDQ